MNPKVSIILTTFNGSSRGYLEAAIESVINQSFKDYELLLVDDGSTDNTKELCQHYQHHSNVYYYYQENGGLSSARNKGLSFAQGEYILFLDDDDLYEPHLVDEMYRKIYSSDDPKIGMVYCAYHFIDENNKSFGKWYIPAEGYIYERLFYDNYAGSPSGTMIRKSVFNDVGIFREELKSCEDYDMWIRIAKKYHVHSIDAPLLRYRIHGENMSSSLEKIEYWQKKVLNDALEDSPSHIHVKRHQYLYHLNLEFSAKYFEVSDYANFRRCCDEAKKYGHLSTKWKLKYYISHLPMITKFLFHTKRAFLNE